MTLDVTFLSTNNKRDLFMRMQRRNRFDLSETQIAVNPYWGGGIRSFLTWLRSPKNQSFLSNLSKQIRVLQISCPPAKEAG